MFRVLVFWGFGFVRSQVLGDESVFDALRSNRKLSKPTGEDAGDVVVQTVHPKAGKADNPLQQLSNYSSSAVEGMDNEVVVICMFPTSSVRSFIWCFGLHHKVP